MREAVLQALAGAAACFLATVALAADCNQNGLEDAQDIRDGRSRDCDRNALPDECDLRDQEVVFAAPAIFPTFEESGQLSLADLDHDAKVEVLAVGGFGTGLIERIGQGAGGAFEKLPLVTVSTGVRLIAAADLDGDGDNDLVAATNQPGLQTAVQSADGSFGLASNTLTPEFSFAIAVGDLDEDGKPDAVLLGSAGNVHLLLGDGRGTLALLVPPIRFPGLEASAGRAFLRDMDLDGDLDLAASGGSPSRVTLFRNAGKGALALEDVATLRSLDNVLSFAVLDHDADGFPDIAATGPAAANRIFTFTSLLPAEPGFSLRAHETPWSNVSLAAADLDGDRRDDLLGTTVQPPGSCSISESRSWILVSQGEAFGTRYSVSLPPDPPHVAAAGDVDGDGVPDLVARTSSASILTLLVRHGTRAQDCNANGIPDACEMKAGDCDLDGMLDECELATPSADCDRNGLPDACDPDCDSNGIADACDLAAGTHRDCNANALPDACEPGADADRDGIPDDCELGAGRDADCNQNGIPDAADLLPTVQMQLASRIPVLPLTISTDPFISYSYQTHVAAADLDGDGTRDLAVARGVTCCPLRPGSVHASRSLHRGRSPAFEVARIENPIDITAVDLDLDGASELVVLDRALTWCPADASVWLLPNAGDGSFRQRRPVPAADGAAQAVAADFTGDGAPDLALLTGLDRPINALVVLAGDGRGGLGSPPGPQQPLQYGGEGVAADLDGDGDADMLFSSQVGALHLFRNAGAGAFAPAVQLSEPQVYGAPLALDAEGDGDIDILANSCDGLCALRLLRNDGPGTFRRGETLPSRTTVLRGIVSDLDLDGDSDVVAAGFLTTNLSLTNNAVIELFINRQGKLEPGTEALVGAGPITDLASLERPGGSPPELALAFDSRSWITLIDDPAASALQEPNPLFATPANATAMTLGDLDRDGRDDAITTYVHLAELRVWRGVADGFSPAVAPLIVGEASFAAASADLDQDGNDDVAYTDSTGIQVLRIGPALTPRPAPYVALGATAHQLEAADLDADGDLDLVVLTDTRVVTALQAQAGVFERGPSIPVPTTPIRFASGDWTADGRPDVAVLGLNPTVADTVAFYSSGEGGRLAPRGTIAVPLLSSSIRTGDVDGDGDLDLGVTHRQAECFTYLEGTGDLRFVRHASNIRERWLSHAALPDLDGDGKADLAMLGAGSLAVLGGEGDGTFRFLRGLPLDSDGGSSIEPRDLDLDGRIDLAVLAHDEDADLLFVLWNGTEPGSYDHDRDGVLDECGPQGVVTFRRGDVNQDGSRNLTDAIAVLDHLFLTARPLGCKDAADANDDGQLNITDAVALLGFLFLGERTLPRPFESCGFDPTADDFFCRLQETCR